MTTEASLGDVPVASLTHRKRAEIIADHLRRQIVGGEIPEGRLLPSESELTTIFGVSRPTMREALRILESESLLTIRSGSGGGARVQHPNAAAACRAVTLLMQLSHATFEDVYQLRIMMEPPAAGNLTSAGQKAVRDLRDLLAAEQNAINDPEAHAEASTAFHRGVVHLGGNKALVVMTDVLAELVEGHCALHTADAGLSPEKSRRERQRGVRAHERLLELVESGDSAATEAFWRRHMVSAGEELLSNIESKTLLDLLP